MNRKGARQDTAWEREDLSEEQKKKTGIQLFSEASTKILVV